jgi:hypothetical protein
MIEITRPMSWGRVPFLINAGISSDFPVFTNNEIIEVTPGSPGYVAAGFGRVVDSSIPGPYGYGLYVTYNGYDTRTVTSGSDYQILNTPKFQVSVYQDDVINKKWTGVTIELTATAQIYSAGVYTPYDQVFTYTFTGSNDPVYGASDYSAPNGNFQEVLGTEYQAQADIGGVAYFTYPDPITSWFVTAVSPPP